MSRYGSGCCTINFYDRLSASKVRWILDKDFNSFVDGFYLMIVQFIYIRFQDPSNWENNERPSAFPLILHTFYKFFFIKINGVFFPKKKTKVIFLNHKTFNDYIAFWHCIGWNPNPWFFACVWRLQEGNNISFNLFAHWLNLYVFCFFPFISPICFISHSFSFSPLFFFFCCRWKRRKRIYERQSRRSWIFHHLNRQPCEC